jgi:hypothetical protein
VLTSLTPGHQVVKIVHDELVSLSAAAVIASRARRIRRP